MMDQPAIVQQAPVQQCQYVIEESAGSRCATKQEYEAKRIRIDENNKSGVIASIAVFLVVMVLMVVIIEASM